jgi:hypothetical protein
MSNVLFNIKLFLICERYVILKMSNIIIFVHGVKFNFDRSIFNRIFCLYQIQ